MPPKKHKKYMVGNPYGVRAGLPILTRKDGTQYYEGDAWEPQPGMPEEVIKRRISQGFLIEVKDGG